MILVTTGTTTFPFNRLIDFCVETLADKEKVILQTTTLPTKPLPKNFKLVKMIGFKQMNNLYKQADLIISAAGEGTILQLIDHAQGQTILFPRNPKYGEHIDDQQLLIAKKMKQLGWFQVAFSTQELAALLKLPIKSKV